MGAGEAPSGFPTEREEEAGGGLGKEEAGWARPKKGRGGGLLGLQAEKRKGKGGKGFLFLYTFSK